jgi:hypothetical protein
VIRYVIGADVGDRRDPAAIGIHEMVARYKDMTLPDEVEWARLSTQIIHEYHLRLLERPELGTGYPALVERLASIASSPSIVNECICVVDATGVGEPIVQMLRDRLRIDRIPTRVVAIYATPSGSRVGLVPPLGYSVPKDNLVTVTSAVYDSGRIRIAEGLKHAAQLELEVEHFIPKTTNRGSQTFAASNDAIHDDLISMQMISLWYAETTLRRREIAIGASNATDQRDQYDPMTYGLNAPDASSIGLPTTLGDALRQLDSNR